MTATTRDTVRKLSSSTIGTTSNHSCTSISSSSRSNRGNLVSITVRKDDIQNKNKKAGIKLQQDSEGQITVKNVANNGLFGNTELEVGDIILSVNKRRLSNGEGPEELMKFVHKYNTITVAVRKPTSLSKKKKNDKKKKKAKKKDKDASKTKIVTITAEKHTTAEIDSTKNKNENVGLVLEIRNRDQLVVKDILPTSIFAASEATCNKNAELDIGDRILCINDMSFRQFADVEYAYQILNKAKIVITLVVEKQKKKKKKKKKKSTSITSEKIPKSSNSSFCSDDTSITSGTISDEFYIGNSNHSGGFMTNSSRYEFEVESDFKIERYRPVTITVPKPQKWVSSTDTIGVQFKVVQTNVGDILNDVEEHDEVVCNNPRTTSWIAVNSIEKDSLFHNTQLKVGDKIISINDTDLRESSNNNSTSNSNQLVDKRKAYNACLKAKEFITMIVLKDDETIFFEKSFCFDNSVTNLEWKY